MAFDHEINPKIKNNVARIRTEVKYDFLDDITALNFMVEWVSFYLYSFYLIEDYSSIGCRDSTTYLSILLHNFYEGFGY
jgi:hypothetical protein